MRAAGSGSVAAVEADLDAAAGRRSSARASRRERAAADRRRHVERLGEVRDLVLGLGPGEERRVGAERAEAEAAARRAASADGVAGERASRYAPIRHRKTPTFGMLWRPRPRAIRRTSSVRGIASNAVPTARARRRRAATARRRLPGRRWFMYCVVASSSKNSTTRAAQPVTSRASCSSTTRCPCGGGSAIVCATSARREPEPRRQAVQRAVADQVADVRHHPRRAGLDELVVVELLEALLEHGDLLGERGEQRLQRALLGRDRAGDGGVPQPVDGRQELEQRRVVGHGSTPSSSAAGSMVSSSAALTPSAAVRPAARRTAAAARAATRGWSERRRSSTSTATTPRDAVDDRDDLVERDRLAEVARVERERREQRGPDRREHVVGHGVRGDLDRGAEPERRAAGRSGPSARTSGSPYERSACEQARVGRRRPASIAAPSGPATVRNTPRAGPVPSPGRVRLGDPREAAREVLVVAQRDRAVEREHGERRVARAAVAATRGPRRPTAGSGLVTRRRRRAAARAAW